MTKRDKFKKRVYVCSPYTALLALGGNAPSRIASVAVKKAEAFYNDPGVFMYSPVLDAKMQAYKGGSWEVVREVCLEALSECNELFVSLNCVSDGDYVKNSVGIFAEYCAAVEKNIPVASDTPEILEFLAEKRSKKLRFKF